MEATTETTAQAAKEKRLAAETLRGDVRDAMLTLLRDMQTPFSKLSENDQSWRIEAVSRLAEKVVRDSIRIVANQGFPHVEVLVRNKGKFAGGSMELSMTAPFSVENATKLSDYGVGTAILVLAEPGEFFGERRTARPQPDQTSFLGDEDEEQGAPVADDEREFAGHASPDAGTRPSKRNRRVIRETEAA